MKGPSDPDREPGDPAGDDDENAPPAFNECTDTIYEDDEDS